MDVIIIMIGMEGVLGYCSGKTYGCDDHHKWKRERVR